MYSKNGTLSVYEELKGQTPAMASGLSDDVGRSKNWSSRQRPKWHEQKNRGRDCVSVTWFGSYACQAVLMCLATHFTVILVSSTSG
jgi:hypothetical protein